MCEGVLCGNSLLRIERQTAFEEVESLVRSVGIDLGEGSSFFERKRSKVISRSLRVDGVVFLERRCSEDVEDESELVMI